MHILLTGGSGFIGSNLAKRCLDESWEVDIVDDMSNGHIEFLPYGHPVITKDFAHPDVIYEIKQGRYDVVFHLAAVPRVSYSVEHPLETNHTNVSRTLALMDACRGNIKRFVFASSSAVYGGADVLPTAETERKNPRSPYALQKSIIEDYLKLYRDLYGLDSVCLRFFNVFGPNALGSSAYATALAAWLTAIKNGVPIRSDGDGSQTRDMCYVDNVTDACVKAGSVAGPLNAECINVACGDRTTNREIIASLGKRFPEAKVYNSPWRAGDVMHTQADITKAKQLLGYEPRIRVWEGIDRTVRWFDDNWPRIQNLGLNK